MWKVIKQHLIIYWGFFKNDKTVTIYYKNMTTHWLIAATYSERKMLHKQIHSLLNCDIIRLTGSFFCVGVCVGVCVCVCLCSRCICKHVPCVGLFRDKVSSANLLLLALYQFSNPKLSRLMYIFNNNCMLLENKQKTNNDNKKYMTKLLGRSKNLQTLPIPWTSSGFLKPSQMS